MLYELPNPLSATAHKPGRLLTHNTKHLAPAVAKQSGVRIATAAEFFRTLSSLLGLGFTPKLGGAASSLGSSASSFARLL
jgi:hypothetical protein